MNLQQSLLGNYLFPGNAWSRIIVYELRHKQKRLLPRIIKKITTDENKKGYPSASEWCDTLNITSWKYSHLGYI